ncbi:hypothetical protein FRB90_004806 [Tulasnella sp. 427]|nr:hypothetical protein FRB90_004806 [Tulasnella sp. 427]
MSQSASGPAGNRKQDKEQQPFIQITRPEGLEMTKTSRGIPSSSVALVQHPEPKQDPKAATKST